jgi:hypothetical protein
MTRELYQRATRLLDELKDLRHFGEIIQEDTGAVEVIRGSDSIMLSVPLRNIFRECIRARWRKIEEEFAAL